ncbi:MAG: sodium/glutamate symporter [Dehalobacterium sp.]
MTFGPYNMLMDFCLMSVLLLIAQFLRAKIKLIQCLYLPSSLIAGFFGLFFGQQFLNWIPFSDQIGGYAYLLVVVLFASLFIGNSEKMSVRKIFNDVGDTFTMNLAAEIGGFGVALLIGGFILVSLFPEVNQAFAILLPSGFIGGHGYAAAIGGSLQELIGWEEAVTIGQTFATFGLLTGVFAGLILINWATRANATRFVKGIGELPESMRTGLVPANEQFEMGKNTVNPMSIDPLTWHVLLVFIATAGGYYATNWFGVVMPKVSLPMMSVSMLAGVLLHIILKGVGLAPYVDKRIITRIGSSVTDYLVAFGVASIKISIVIKYATPLVIFCILGLCWSLFMVYLGKKLFHNFWFERSIFLFGWTTGVVAMGVTLLRIVDPEFKSKTLEEYGTAYVLISIIELFIVSISPIYAAKGQGIIAGVVMCSIAAVLFILTAIKYGWKKSKGSELRPGEAEAIGM